MSRSKADLAKDESHDVVDHRSALHSVWGDPDHRRKEAGLNVLRVVTIPSSLLGYVPPGV